MLTLEILEYLGGVGFGIQIYHHFLVSWFGQRLKRLIFSLLIFTKDKY